MLKFTPLKALLAGMLACVATSASAYDVTKMTWKEIEDQAKKEGTVSFAVWYLQPGWREFVKGFEDQYGIKVRIPEGTLDGNRNKLIAESKREKGKLDVIALGASNIKIFSPEKVLLKLDVLPEITNLNTESEGFDSEGYAVTFWGNQTGIAYDPSRIKEQDLPQSFEQLSQYMETYSKSFGVNDPNGGGSGGRFIEAAIRNYSGEPKGKKLSSSVTQKWSKTWDWFNQYEDNMVITASNADSLTRINDGEIVLAPAWEDHLAGLQRRGAITSRLKFYIPKFGMSGGANFAAIAKNSQRKAASVLFLHWLTSAETQTALNAKFGVAPQHPNSDASQALVSQEMRSRSTQPFNAIYGKEMSKQFTQRVLMK
ncbi:extracellular solute-binding protein [Vibrio penaeicida]|uniref:ABC transporter substrate-binding protein n=1 Tax=Vibrio penaeicida TaxID=104609 RepID=UPI0027356D4E|nr:extracellular solute-binding protein [Vibrio penaeicida]MDP2572188.1 extracellular solute-binding protein [Vibrio penaeicida]